MSSQVSTTNIKPQAKMSVGFKFDLQSYTLIIALVVIAIIFGFFTGGDFLSSRNLSNLFTQMAVISVLAVGMTLVIVAGHIDLSVGSIVGLTGGIAAILQGWMGWNTVASIVAALVAGAIIGLWQGWWTAYRNVPSFIVTLGGMLIFRGVLLGLSKGQTISGLSNSFGEIGSSFLPYIVGWILAFIGVVLLFFSKARSRAKRQTLGLINPALGIDYGRIIAYSVCILFLTYMLNRYLGIPLPLLIVVVLAGIFMFTSNKTSFGRYIYAIGGNVEAAALSGINIKRNILYVFVLMGALAGVAGVLLTSRLNAATTDAGSSYELDAIAACVIGGTSLMGGKGNIVGAIIGALIMTSIDNGMSMMNIEAFWQYIVKGMILILAVWMDISNQKK